MKFHILVLNNDSQDWIQLWDVGIEKVKVLLFDLQDDGRLNGFDKQGAWLARMKTANIGDPVILSGKLDVMLGSFRVNGKQAKAAFNDKRVVFAGESFLQDSLSASD